MALLGIDFGSATVRAVVVHPGGEPSAVGVLTTPSLVSFGERGPRAGEPVLLTLGAVSEVVVSGIKRILGRSVDDPLVVRAGERGGFVARVHDRDLALRAADARDAAPEMTMVDGVAELLRYLVELAAGRGGHEAVIAVPSWFEAPQRDALVAAARLAHIKVLRFVRDTVASALWLANAHGERGRAGIVDLGAGGLNVSLVTLRDDEVRLELSRGNAAQGGDDIDSELAEQAPVRPERRERELVCIASEALKRALGQQDHVERELSLGDKKMKLSLERWQLDLLLAPLCAAIAELGRGALDDAGWRPDDLDSVIACGGMAELAPIASAIEKLWGKKPERPPEGLDAAVLGAGLIAAGSSSLRLVDGERPPQAEAPTPPAKGPMFHGPVVMKRKPPERFRPEVKLSRRRRASRPDEPMLQDIVPPTTVLDASGPKGPEVIEAPSSTHDTPPPQAERPGLPAPSSAPPSHTPVPKRPSPVAISIVHSRRHSMISDELTLPRDGDFVQPTTAIGVMAMAITRPLVEHDLDPIALPVLFRRILARRSIVGTVAIEAPDFELTFDVESGSAAMTRSEHALAQRVWDIHKGRWRLHEERQRAARRDLYPLNRLALDGIKRMLRALPSTEIDKAFGDLMELSPQVRSDRLTLPKRLGLGGRELRFIDNILNGRLSGRRALTESLGPSNSLQLFALLELFDALMWTELGQNEASPRSLLGRRSLMGMATETGRRSTKTFESRKGDDDEEIT